MRTTLCFREAFAGTPAAIAPRIALDECLAGLLRQIPFGRVATFGDLARALGDRAAARWVGAYVMRHPHDETCPCHRVVRVDGQLGGYLAGSTEDKARLLREEGVTVRDDRADLAETRFDRFVSDRPLAALRRTQEEVVERARLTPRRRLPRLVGGVDISYVPSGNAGEGDGVAAYVLVEIGSNRVLWSTTVRRSVAFPYITGYLAFRELPLLLDLVDTVRQAGQLADVLLVDGSGMLHPCNAGVATHLGVTTGLPTIGVTKKLLVGRVDLEGIRPRESRPVFHDDMPLGLAVRPTAGSSRPIFVSPGHRVDVDFCGQVVASLLTGRRLPEPLYWADRLSRQAARGED